MKKTPVRLVIGMGLLAVGVLLLIERAGVVRFDLMKLVGYVLLLAGGFQAVTGFGAADRKRILWGSIVFLIAVLTLFMSYGLVPASWDQTWPSVLVIPGLALLMVYFSDLRDFALLAVSAFFVSLGIVGLILVKGEITLGGSIEDTVTAALPVAIIIAGVYVFRRSLTGRNDPH